MQISASCELQETWNQIHPPIFPKWAQVRLMWELADGSWKPWWPFAPASALVGSTCPEKFTLKNENKKHGFLSSLFSQGLRTDLDLSSPISMGSIQVLEPELGPEMNHLLSRLDYLPEVPIIRTGLKPTTPTRTNLIGWRSVVPKGLQSLEVLSRIRAAKSITRHSSPASSTSDFWASLNSIPPVCLPRPLTQWQMLPGRTPSDFDALKIDSCAVQTPELPETLLSTGLTMGRMVDLLAIAWWCTMLPCGVTYSRLSTALLPLFPSIWLIWVCWDDGESPRNALATRRCTSWLGSLDI